MYKSITGTSAPTPPPFFKSPIFFLFPSSFYSISSFFLPILIRKILLCLTIDDVGKDVDDEERRHRKKNREDVVVVGWLNGGVSVIGEWDEAKKRRAWICSSSKDKQKWLIDWHSSVQAPPLATLQFQLYVTTVVAVATPPHPHPRWYVSPTCFPSSSDSLYSPQNFFFRFFQLPPPLTTNRYSTQRRKKEGGE